VERERPMQRGTLVSVVKKEKILQQLLTDPETGEPAWIDVPMGKEEPNGE
jgi:hypothetical protein